MWKGQYRLATSREISVNVHHVLQLSRTQCLLPIYTLSGLGVLTWFVVTHFGLLGVLLDFSLCEKQPNHRIKLQTYKPRISNGS